MDFFEGQEQAKKKTKHLVFFFFCAVVLIFAAIYGVIAFLLQSQGQNPVNPILMGITFGVVGLTIGGGSAFKTLSLRGGGKTVASLLDARLIQPDTTDHEERVLLNVVEEMAIAAGMPVPPVYVMEDEADSINAFAAGTTIDDAVIGVTRGCLHLLSRDELQGVVAHEFSHILNGDMRLNIRLIGILHGILLLGLIGYFILRSVGRGRMHSRRRSRDNEGGVEAAILVVGVGLFVVGYIGVFFGKLIKSAVSRQREYLADASAIQFTRNPDGLAGALMKTGSLAGHGKIQHPRAEEASHLFFNNAISSMSGALSTHPPLEERVRRIYPNFTGTYPELGEALHQNRKRPYEDKPYRKKSQTAGGSAFPMDGHGMIVLGGLLDQVGSPTAEQTSYAARLLNEIPESLLIASHNHVGARAIAYLILIHSESTIQKLQLSQLQKNGDPAVIDAVNALKKQTLALPEKLRLPLIDMTLPALRELSLPQFETFTENIDFLIEADGVVELYEICLRRIIVHHLQVHLFGPGSTKERYNNVSQLIPEISILIHVISEDCDKTDEETESAFLAANKIIPGLTKIVDIQDDILVVDEILDQLAQASPSVKKLVLQACSACIESDHHVSIHEAEVFRALAESMGCPAPLLLPGQAADC